MSEIILLLKGLKRFLMRIRARCVRRLLLLRHRLTPPIHPDVKLVGCNLHLGCGEVYHPNFINVDGYPFKNVHHVMDISNLDYFRTGSVDLVYASHCLEHFPYGRIQAVLTEWHRVLKTGGILRLSVPDFDLLMDIFHDTKDLELVIPEFFGGQDNPFNFHYMIFNERNLSERLRRVGFREIRRWEPGTEINTTFNDFSIHRKTVNGIAYPVSLNVEAVK